MKHRKEAISDFKTALKPNPYPHEANAGLKKLGRNLLARSEMRPRIDLPAAALAHDVDKTDAYGLSKRLNKLSAAPGMKATLDGVKQLISEE